MRVDTAKTPCAAMDAQSVFDIRDFGASETNTAAQNAAAIQRAIDAAGNAENGMVRFQRADDTQDACRARFTVVVPPGTFPTGTLRLRPHVELRLEKGAVFLSKNVRLEGVNIVDSPTWTTLFRCCEGVAIRGVSIRNDRTVANSDGFSIDCSQNVGKTGRWKWR